MPSHPESPSLVLIKPHAVETGRAKTLMGTKLQKIQAAKGLTTVTPLALPWCNVIPDSRNCVLLGSEAPAPGIIPASQEMFIACERVSCSCLAGSARPQLSEHQECGTGHCGGAWTPARFLSVCGFGLDSPSLSGWPRPQSLGHQGLVGCAAYGPGCRCDPVRGGFQAGIRELKHGCVFCRRAGSSCAFNLAAQWGCQQLGVTEMQCGREERRAAGHSRGPLSTRVISVPPSLPSPMLFSLQAPPATPAPRP